MSEVHVRADVWGWRTMSYEGTPVSTCVASEYLLEATRLWGPLSIPFTWEMHTVTLFSHDSGFPRI